MKTYRHPILGHGKHESAHLRLLRRRLERLDKLLSHIHRRPLERGACHMEAELGVLLPGLRDSDWDEKFAAVRKAVLRKE